MEMESKSLLFKELFEKHGKNFAGMLHGLKYSEDEIEEIMQNAYMKAFDNFHTLKDENAFIPWFKKIVINEGKQLIRKKNAGKRKMMVFFESDEALNRALDEKAWNEYCVSNDIETRLSLREAMDALPEKYLRPFKLSVVEHYTYREIAEVEEINEGTVKSRISRAKAILRENLQDKEIEKEKDAADV